MSWSDGYTDEVQTTTLALGYANKTIAHINTTFNMTLPFITNVETDYTALNDNWFVRFMIASLSYGIKMNDGSISEAQAYANDLSESMYDFEGIDKTTAVQVAYLPDAGSSIYIIDTTNAIDIGWFGSGNSSSGW